MCVSESTLQLDKLDRFPLSSSGAAFCAVFCQVLTSRSGAVARKACKAFYRACIMHRRCPGREGCSFSPSPFHQHEEYPAYHNEARIQSAMPLHGMEGKKVRTGGSTAIGSLQQGT